MAHRDPLQYWMQVFVTVVVVAIKQKSKHWDQD
jgi:hypothetical protein